MPKEAPPAASEVKAPKNRTKLILILVILFLVVVIVLGGALLLLSGSHSNDGDDDDEEEVSQRDSSHKRKKSSEPPVFSSLDRMTVNLRTGPEGPQTVFVLAEISLEIEDVSADIRIKTQMPRIRDIIIGILSNKTEAELLPREGKEKLAEEIRTGINEILEPPIKGKKAPDGPVLAVLFTTF
ncbi:MAG: flagellar basal body-associated FliL family protein, partial [Zoogloeaceae bacterium]|nr:flagellar basal body-associated FliL family protein [Zoogloeaceae bacterium]